MMKFLCTFFVILSYIRIGKSDLPVHCLMEETIGTWTIYKGPNDQDRTELCGHEMPDKVMTMPKLYKNKGDKSGQFPGFTVKQKKTFVLSTPNIVTMGDKKGSWTMVYDEGIEFKVDNVVYFAFFRYEPKSEDVNPAKIEDFTSHCKETFVGWYHNTDDSNWGCFYAVKQITEVNTAHEKRMKEHKESVVSGEKIVSPTSKKQENRKDQTVDFIMQPIASSFRVTNESLKTITPDERYVDLVNNDIHSTWKARLNHEIFEGKTTRDMMKMLGTRTYLKESPAKAQKKEISEKLPKNWDWREVDGGKYMTDIKDQGSCGSCYSIAALDVANMKVRIKTNGRVNPNFSVQNNMSCSVYNQGCEGGYPFLSAKMGSDIGLVPEECQPYTGSDDDKCNDECFKDKDKVYRVLDYHYVGGYYGACNEADMLEAIKISPIEVALNAPPNLFYYDGGVYSSEVSKASKDYMVHGDSRWEKTNHAVIAVGWGEEKVEETVTKYWIIKNSWGSSWGDAGYFKMKRGSDDCAIESMAVNFKIMMPDGTIAP